MAWIHASKLSELKSMGRHTIELNGHQILLIAHEEQIYAVQAKCPHLKLPLKKARIDEQCHIVCPFHKSAFNLKNGAVECWSSSPSLVGPLLGKLSKPKDLQIYPVRIEEDEILVEV